MTRIRFASFVLCVLASPAVAQISTNFTPAASVTAAAATSLPVPVTVNSGANRLLIVMIAQEYLSATVNPGIASVTRGSGASLQTLLPVPLAAGSVTSASNRVNTSNIYYLFAPNVNSDAISVTTAGGSSVQITAAAFAFNGVEQSVAGLRGVNNSAAAFSISSNITPAAAGSWVLDLGVYSISSGNMTAGGTGHSEYAGLQNNANMTAEFGHRDNLPSAGQISLGWNQTASLGDDRITHSLVSFSPVPEPAAVGLLAAAGLGVAGLARRRHC